MRTLEEVQATLHIAKLKEEDLNSVTHCLSFSDNVSSGDYCLMELDDTLCKHIEEGKRCAVFCSVASSDGNWHKKITSYNLWFSYLATTASAHITQ